jgi:flagellar L-ring protein precursor FlgH
MLLLAMSMLCGCTERIQSVLDEPQLSAVDTAQHADAVVDVPEQTGSDAAPAPHWIGGPADYFRDDRARQIGDLVTVNIEIDDKANFNNKSDRSRESQISSGSSFDLGILGINGQGEGKLGAGGESSMSGQGTIQRSEKLSISLAATVRQTLPNGHLLISGTQEVLVNSEKRILTIAGIVDPADISRANAVAYERVAEARLSYGGVGRSSDVQKPGWGQQVWDKVTPF